MKEMLIGSAVVGGLCLALGGLAVLGGKMLKWTGASPRYRKDWIYEDRNVYHPQPQPLPGDSQIVLVTPPDQAVWPDRVDIHHPLPGQRVHVDPDTDDHDPTWAPLDRQSRFLREAREERTVPIDRLLDDTGPMHLPATYVSNGTRIPEPREP